MRYERSGYMAFAIIGVKKIKSLKNMNAAFIHNHHLYVPTHTDPSLSFLNEELIPTCIKPYDELFADKINSLQYYQNHDIRSNAVMALEILTTFSHEAMDFIDIEKWKNDNVCWIRNYFNRNTKLYGDNVISAAFHADETTPHIHFIVIPIDERGHLNANGYLGGPHIMRKLQSDYSKYMDDLYGLKRGVMYSSGKREDIRKFYGAMNSAYEEYHAPEIIPGESLEQYKERVEQLIKTMNMEKFVLLKRIEQEKINAVNEAHSKIIHSKEEY